MVMLDTTSHPDLRPAVADFVQRHIESVAQLPFHQQPPAEHQLSEVPAIEEIIIRGQRTWWDVPMHSPRLRGADVSAAVAQFEQYGHLWSFFVRAVRLPRQAEWAIAQSTGGRADDRRDTHWGLMSGGGSNVCVGGLNPVPDGGKIRVILADGGVYEDTAVNETCIVFAPVTATPGPDDQATIQFLDAHGNELASRRVWIGDGRPPRRS
jgi:hypothetical protein